MLHDLIHINYATIVIVLFMVTFLLSNASFERRTIRLFFISIIIVLVLVVVDSVESYTETLTEPTKLRILMSAIGYSLRPLSILCILLIIIRGRRMKRLLLCVPVIINMLVSFSSFFCDWAYSYSETNKFVRGPLGFTAYITSAIYIFILMWATVQYIREKNYYEGLVVFAIVLNSVMSIFLEVVYKFDGIINASMAISITFYYLYYHTQNFKLDPLTQVLNRHYYEIDVNGSKASIKAIVSVDLNDLKVINDTKGHNYGDIALTSVASCMKNNLPRKCKLYRIGGDEFCILCFKDNMEKVLDKMIRDIKKDLEKTSYSCAMGLAIIRDGDTFEMLSERADEAMYENKAIMKKEAAIAVK